MKVTGVKYIFKQKGHITLIAVITVTALGSAIALSLLMLGLGYSKNSYVLERSYQAKALADACAEEALQKINDSTSYEGSGNLAEGNGSCTYTVIKGTGQNREITTRATVSDAIGEVTRKVNVRVDQTNPRIYIAGWEETAD